MAEESTLSAELVITALLGEDALGLSHETWTEVVAAAEAITVSRGELLFRAGDPHRYLFLLTRGRIEVSHTEHPPWIYAGRRFIGPVALTEGAILSRTGTALTESHLVRVPLDVWLDLLEESAALADTAIGWMAKDIAALLAKAPGSLDFPHRVRSREWVAPDDELDRVERLLFLHEASVLGMAGVQALVDLAESAREIKLEPGAELEDAGDRIGVVISGELAMTDPTGVVRARFLAGAVPSFAMSREDLGSVWKTRATTPSRLLAIRRDRWADALEEHFGLVRALLASFGGEHTRLLEMIAEAEGSVVLE
jgi:CRP-like cAMP-binding protein